MPRSTSFSTDLLRRYLEFSGLAVTHVMNITDVEDKIIKAVRATGRTLRDYTAEYEAAFIQDFDALHCLRPTHQPRATEYIGQKTPKINTYRHMIAMILELIAKGHAYVVQGHVLFRVRSYAEYGKLSGRSVDDMIAGARVEIAPFKEDPMDFV